MRAFFILCFLSISFFGCTRAKPRNDLLIENLNGEVHLVIDSTYEVGRRHLFDEQIEEFDTYGNKLKEAVYGPNRQSILSNTFLRKQNGSSVTEIDSAADTINSKSVRLYDQLHFIKATYYYDVQNNLTNIDTIIYERDKIKEEDCYDKNRKQTIKKFYKTDLNGRTIEIREIYNKDSSLLNTVFKYDDKGNVLFYQFKNLTPLTYKYTGYDAQKNWIERIQFENDESRWITKRTIIYY